MTMTTDKVGNGMESMFEQYWREQLWIAGFHRNDRLFTDIFWESTMSLVSAGEFFENGEDARMRGEDCHCDVCNHVRQIKATDFINWVLNH